MLVDWPFYLSDVLEVYHFFMLKHSENCQFYVDAPRVNGPKLSFLGKRVWINLFYDEFFDYEHFLWYFADDFTGEGFNV